MSHFSPYSNATGSSSLIKTSSIAGTAPNNWALDSFRSVTYTSGASARSSTLRDLSSSNPLIANTNHRYAKFIERNDKVLETLKSFKIDDPKRKEHYKQALRRAQSLKKDFETVRSHSLTSYLEQSNLPEFPRQTVKCNIANSIAAITQINDYIESLKEEYSQKASADYSIPIPQHPADTLMSPTVAQQEGSLVADTTTITLEQKEDSQQVNKIEKSNAREQSEPLDEDLLQMVRTVPIHIDAYSPESMVQEIEYFERAEMLEKAIREQLPFLINPEVLKQILARRGFQIRIISKSSLSTFKGQASGNTIELSLIRVADVGQVLSNEIHHLAIIMRNSINLIEKGTLNAFYHILSDLFYQGPTAFCSRLRSCRKLFGLEEDDGTALPRRPSVLDVTIPPEAEKLSALLDQGYEKISYLETLYRSNPNAKELQDLREAIRSYEPYRYSRIIEDLPVDAVYNYYVRRGERLADGRLKLPLTLLQGEMLERVQAPQIYHNRDTFLHVITRLGSNNEHYVELIWTHAFDKSTESKLEAFFADQYLFQLRYKREYWSSEKMPTTYYRTPEEVTSERLSDIEYLPSSLLDLFFPEIGRILSNFFRVAGYYKRASRPIP